MSPFACSACDFTAKNRVIINKHIQTVSGRPKNPKRGRRPKQFGQQQQTNSDHWDALCVRSEPIPAPDQYAACLRMAQVPQMAKTGKFLGSTAEGRMLSTHPDAISLPLSSSRKFSQSSDDVVVMEESPSVPDSEETSEESHDDKMVADEPPSPDAVAGPSNLNCSSDEVVVVEEPPEETSEKESHDDTMVSEEPPSPDAVARPSNLNCSTDEDEAVQAEPADYSINKHGHEDEEESSGIESNNNETMAEDIPKPPEKIHQMPEGSYVASELYQEERKHQEELKALDQSIRQRISSLGQLQSIQQTLNEAVVAKFAHLQIAERRLVALEEMRKELRKRMDPCEENVRKNEEALLIQLKKTTDQTDLAAETVAVLRAEYATLHAQFQYTGTLMRDMDAEVRSDIRAYDGLEKALARIAKQRKEQVMFFFRPRIASLPPGSIPPSQLIRF